MTYIGVSLAVHNSREQTQACLLSLFNSENVALHVVVIDDGSTDGTREMVVREFPKVILLRGNGELWWTGATNIGVRECLEADCDAVVLLNPDVIVEPDTIATLYSYSQALDDAIVSPLVLNHDKPDLIWEAGHRWERAFKSFPFFWVSRYIYKHNTPVSEIPRQAYATVSVVGRGGLMPRKAFDILGLFDEKHLPHYGADADMALRAWNVQYPMYIVPDATVRLHTKTTGRSVQQSFRAALKQYWHYLTARKQGEALRVLYYWNVNNMPKYIAIPNYIFLLGLNTFRYWQAYLKARIAS